MAALDIEGAPEQLAEQQRRDGDREHENGHADGRPVAEARVPKALQVDEVAEHVGSTERRPFVITAIRSNAFSDSNSVSITTTAVTGRS